MLVSLVFLACAAGVQRGGRGKLTSSAKYEESEARSLGSSRSNLTSPLPTLCTPATQAIVFNFILRKIKVAQHFNRGKEVMGRNVNFEPKIFRG